MSKIRLQLLMLVAMTMSVLSVVGFARFSAEDREAARAGAPAPDPLLREIVDYRKWTRVNERPILVIDPLTIGG